MLQKLQKCYFHTIDPVSDRNIQTIKDTDTILPMHLAVDYVYDGVFGYRDPNVDVLCSVSQFLKLLVSDPWLISNSDAINETADGILVMDIYKFKGPIVRHLYMTQVESGLFDILCFWNSSLLTDLFADIPQAKELKSIHNQIRAQDPYLLYPYLVDLGNISNAFTAVFRTSIASEFYIDSWVSIAKSLINNCLINARQSLEYCINSGKFNQRFVELSKYYCNQISKLLQTPDLDPAKILSMASEIKQMSDAVRLIVMLEPLMINSNTMTGKDMHVFLEYSMDHYLRKDLQPTLISLGLKSEQQLRFVP